MSFWSHSPKAALVETLDNARSVAREDILGTMKRDELKAACQASGMDDSGRAKLVIIDRIDWCGS